VGASGSIGTAAVQLAKHFGAEVTAVTSGKNAELVSRLGAHRVVDYTQADYTAEPSRYDVVFDTVGKSSFAAARRCLSPTGRYLVTTGSMLLYLRDAWSRLFGAQKLMFGMSVEKRQALRTVAELARAGALRPVIDRTYPMAGVADAHRYVDTGRKRGNVVISVSAAERAPLLSVG
jgi:NADPH2:quinone reductase